MVKIYPDLNFYIVSSIRLIRVPKLEYPHSLTVGGEIVEGNFAHLRNF